MTGVALARLQEHLDRCHASLTNVGADGVNQLQMHLRLAVEWAAMLSCEVARNGQALKEYDKEAIAALTRNVIGLNGTTVIRLPEAINNVRSQLSSLLSN